MLLYSLPLLVSAALLATTSADTPANCTFDSILGNWWFYEGNRGYDHTVDCSNTDISQLNHRQHVELLFPNVAVDDFGNEGFWTIIYNQGFEVRLNGRKYFAFSNWTGTAPGPITSYCDKTNPGWAHDILLRDWSCFMAVKQEGNNEVHTSHRTRPLIGEDEAMAQTYKTDYQMINKINKMQKSWKAGPYRQFETMKMKDVVRLAGGRRSRGLRPNKVSVVRDEPASSHILPKEFDWRNFKGQNYVSPIRNQATCGSCFAFSSMAMLESRLRILTNNTFQPVFSPQDVIECSNYAQGCDGGFPYLIAGKYAEDFGVVAEKDNPYKGSVTSCTTPKESRRFYATDYHYIGGFYGGCNEVLMLEELVKNGPIVVGFEVYDDFMSYTGGIYHHTGMKNRLSRLNKFDPFELTNHAVLVVGYGVDDASNEKFWIVKNSWGEGWGEKGFFRIRRGNDECGIESLAMQSFPIPTY